MNYKALLEKYWAGETSIAEEKALKAYFNSSEVTTELLRYVPLFTYYESSQKKTLNPSVKNLLLAKNKRVGKPIIRTKKYLIRSIAAAILVAIMATIGFQKTQVPSKAERVAAYWVNKEIKDPKEAFLKTKAALLLVSKKLNNGRNAALKQVTKVQQVGQFIKSPE
ncbi:MAG: hypothetical protein AB8G86_18380 [Saprospiraceae bacterium]